MKQSEFLRRVLDVLVADGWQPFEVDGEPVSTVEQTMTEARALDESYIYLAKDERVEWIMVVWQGPDETYEPGEEVVADYRPIFSRIIEPLYEEASR